MTFWLIFTVYLVIGLFAGRKAALWESKHEDEAYPIALGMVAMCFWPLFVLYFVAKWFFTSEHLIPSLRKKPNIKLIEEMERELQEPLPILGKRFGN